MSTGLECLFVEAQLGKWYWLLATTRDDFDWIETADVVGPFTSSDEAQDHLFTNNANPGGFSERQFDPNRPITGSLAAAVKRARSPRRRYSNPW